MEKLHTDQIGSVNIIHVTSMASIAISAIVHFIHVGILQQAENGLKVKAFGTVPIVIGYTKRKQLNA